MWGDNKDFCISSERRSNRITEEELISTIEPIRIKWKTKVSYIAAGYNNSAFITESGDVYYWGKFHQVFDKPKKAKIKENISKIFLGHGCLFLITTDGEVYSMGSGENYQLGNGSKEDTDIPKLVNGIGLFFYLI